MSNDTVPSTDGEPQTSAEFFRALGPVINNLSDADKATITPFERRLLEYLHDISCNVGVADTGHLQELVEIAAHLQSLVQSIDAMRSERIIPNTTELHAQSKTDGGTYPIVGWAVDDGDVAHPIVAYDNRKWSFV